MISTVLVVDDHAGFRSFVSTLLAGDRFKIAGAAEDGASALEAVASLRPDLVLLDVQLPDMDGFEVAARLAAGPEPPGVVLTSTRDAVDFGTRLANAAVLGFLPKQEMSVEAITKLVDQAGQRPAALRVEDA